MALVVKKIVDLYFYLNDEVSGECQSSRTLCSSIANEKMTRLSYFRSSRPRLSIHVESVLHDRNSGCLFAVRVEMGPQIHERSQTI